MFIFMFIFIVNYFLSLLILAKYSYVPPLSSFIFVQFVSSFLIHSTT